MVSDPLTTFGHLLRGCINDEYSEESGMLKQGVLVMLLGAVSSVLTTYALSALGLFV